MKNFLRNYANNYPVEVVYCGGDPRLVLMNKQGQELEQFDLADLSEEGIGNLLEAKGFFKYQ